MNIDAFILLYIWTDRWNIWRVTDFAGEEKFRRVEPNFHSNLLLSVVLTKVLSHCCENIKS